MGRTWASILLQSVSYGQFYGITGSYWYAPPLQHSSMPYFSSLMLLHKYKVLHASRCAQRLALVAACTGSSVRLMLRAGRRYAVNDAIIMWLFAVVALELKHRAPKAHTMLVRCNGAHSLFSLASCS